MTYLWIKTFHVVFVMAWMAAVFYLPRILVNLAEVGDQPDVRNRLLLMGGRLYRFGHFVFGVAFILGLTLWLYFDIDGGWLYLKLVLVAILLIHFTWSGRLLKKVEKGHPLPSVQRLRLLNELPVVVLIGVVYLVLAKPDISF